ncbi:MAG TPA: ABC transporter permease [Acidobacteriota bacterium]|nr:ABC transporter permease [Acidobacteriota bacterium]
MVIPLSYNYRNLLARKLTTLMTVLGITLVVFVFAAVLMLAYGLKRTLISTGSEDNWLVIRKSATSDLLSQVSRDSVRLVETFPEVALKDDGNPVSSREMVVVINLSKYGSNDMGNVIVRGVSPEALVMRPQVKLIEGRAFETGKSEVIVGKSISQRFQGCRLGQTLKFGTRTWTIVGIFEAEKSGFESEIWADVEQMMASFTRPTYSTLLFRLKDKKDLAAFKARFESEPRLSQLEVRNEQKYFGEQSEQLAKFLTVLGLVITIIFSFGAMIGAMITMYASVANRTVEIGTLRALGFRRTSVLIAFLIEALLISLIGGALGLLLASSLQAFTISMLNFSTFSELAFGFSLNGWIVVSSLIFSVVMGIVGGFFPAVRASRLDIVTALRA